MSTYLIDFENVKSGGLAGIEHIKKEDSVHLFWSARENKITIEMMELIRSSESEIVMHKAVTGERDALDHQLCSYLGFLAGGRGETDFVIVSNDKAYDHLIEFWRKLNDQIHIQRVSEISRAAETVRAVEAVRNADTVAEAAQAYMYEAEPEPVRTDRADRTEKADKSDKGQNEHAEASEHMTPDTNGSRNSRRRERGSRYLKGGRAGRGSRKNNYVENYAEERPEEEKTADTVRETGGYQTETPVPAEPKRESAAAYVVTGIRTGILVESGFTADGILKKSDESPTDSGRKNVVEKTAENVVKQTAEKVPEAAAEKAADNAVEKVQESAAEKAADNAVEKVQESAAEKAADNAVEKVQESAAEKAADNAVEKVREHGTEKTADNAVKKVQESAAEEMPAEAMPEAVKASEAPTAETVPGISVMRSADLSEIPEKEADNVTFEQPLEQMSEKAGEKPERRAAQLKETAEKTAEAEERPVETAEDMEEKAVSPAAAEAAKDEAAEKQSSDNGRKTRPRASRTAARTKRGRPSKQEHTEYIPEIRVPIIESDVIAKCGEAAGAEWTGEVVRLINHSKDKKELYSAIVKLLGQEKGRTVYHAIKVLK